MYLPGTLWIFWLANQHHYNNSIFIVNKFQPNSDRKPLEEIEAVDEDLIDQEVDSKDHPLGGAVGGSGLKTQLSGDGG